MDVTETGDERDKQDFTDIPPELNAALVAFQNELVRWLDEGGDQRLVEFEPMNFWLKVLDTLAVRTIN